MSLHLRILRSGSSGNTTLVHDGRGSRLLIDAGVGPRVLGWALAPLGLTPRDLSGVVLTHAHADHANPRTLAQFAALGVPVHATAGTWTEVRRRHGDVTPRARTLEPGVPFTLDGLEVRACRVPHDDGKAGDAVCFRVSDGRDSLGYATDLGEVTPQVLAHLRDVGLLVLESNHDVDWLSRTLRPDHVKAWIQGARGHLRNEQAAAALSELFRGTEGRAAILAHLSREANHPERALEHARRALCGIAEVQVSVAGRDGLATEWALSGGRAHPLAGVVQHPVGGGNVRSAVPGEAPRRGSDDRRVHRCSVCEAPGHNRLTCPSRTRGSPFRGPSASTSALVACPVRIDVPVPGARRRYRCSSCGHPGHNAATCGRAGVRAAL